jgi:signal transduction histidine kinase
MNSTAPKPASPGSILVIDDEPENLNVLDALLSQAGYRVALFPRGELALAAAQEDPPDLVLLDIRMPGLDGYELCRRFKADERLRLIPILFISALTAADDIAAGFACGGVDYLTKPFREPELLARVRTHLALQRAYAKLAEKHARLQLLEHHRDLLTHMLVHDMRSPLQVIQGHLEMIEDGGAATLPADDRDSLRAAIHGTRLLSGMVSTVIDLSRLESDAIPLHHVAVSVDEIFRAARTQALNPASPRPITEHLADPCPLLLCDAEVSARIVANLLANALKYSPHGREIAFGADPDPGGVRIWVRDRGPGIPAHYHRHIFEKFGVIDQPPGKRPPSTGLGLAFCKLAVEAQGGTIGVESEPGQGSIFWFTLPAAPSATEPTAPITKP